MGYKPGYGLGVNLEGVTTPVKSRLWPQRSPAGLGTNNLTSYQNGMSRNAQDANPATARYQPIPVASQHFRETSASPLSNTTTISSRISSEPSSNQEHRPNFLSENASHGGSSSILLGVDLGSTDSSESAHAGRTPKANTAKTPPSTPKHSDSSHPPIGPQEVTKTRPLGGRSTPASPNVQLPFLASIPSSSPLRLPPPPADSRTSAPVNPPLVFVVHPLPPPPTSTIPYVPKVKGKAAVLGMHLDAKAGGMRGVFLKDLEPPPNPSCSLVMEILPRKFRTQSFILDWLSQFSFQPSRYELVEGKVLFEFRMPKDALLAWNSPRMGGQEGLLGVRLFWYRVLPQTVSASETSETIPQVNVTGTIENPAAQPPQSVEVATTDRLVPEQRSRFIAERSQSHAPTDKLAPPRPPRVPSTISIEEIDGVLVNPLAGDIRSNSDNQTLRGTLSSKTIFASSPTPPPSPATTSPLTAPTPPNDPSHNEMAADCAVTAGFSPGGFPGFVPAATILPTLNPNPPSPMSSLTLASSDSSTSPSLLPTYSPMFVDCQAPLVAPNQEPVQGPHLAAGTPQ
ncbi:hypothetical protein BC827DRAFT_749743 [Russula dissimulans]|nr:hypothetical protein BC827DRAFT_749743 [Russula dissimulans]